jgi:hypothetical protein
VETTGGRMAQRPEAAALLALLCSCCSFYCPKEEEGKAGPVGLRGRMGLLLWGNKKRKRSGLLRSFGPKAKKEKEMYCEFLVAVLERFKKENLKIENESFRLSQKYKFGH